MTKFKAQHLIDRITADQKYKRNRSAGKNRKEQNKNTALKNSKKLLKPKRIINKGAQQKIGFKRNQNNVPSAGR